MRPAADTGGAGRRRWNVLVAAAVACGLSAAVAAPASAQSSSTVGEGPIRTSAGERVGEVRAVVTYAGPAHDMRSQVTVRGSVRLPRGRWCVQTRLRPERAGNPQRSRVVRLTAPRVVAVPVFIRRVVRPFVASDSPTVLAQVRVLAGGCRGRLVAFGIARTKIYE